MSDRVKAKAFVVIEHGCNHQFVHVVSVHRTIVSASTACGAAATAMCGTASPSSFRIAVAPFEPSLFSGGDLEIEEEST